MSLTSTAIRAIKVLLEEGRPARSIKETLQRTFKATEQEADEAIAAELEKSGKAKPKESIEGPTKASPETLIQAPGKTVQETAEAARRGEEKLKAKQTPAAPAAAPATAAPAFTPPTTVLESVQKAQKVEAPTVGEVTSRRTELPEDLYAGYKQEPDVREIPEGSLEGLVESIDVTPGGVSRPYRPEAETGFTLIPKDRNVEFAENMAILNKAETEKAAFKQRPAFFQGPRPLDASTTALVPTPYTAENLADDLRIRNQKTAIKDAFRVQQQATRDKAASQKAAPKSLLVASLTGLAAGSSELFKPEDRIAIGPSSFTVVDVKDDGVMIKDDETNETQDIVFTGPPAAKEPTVAPTETPAQAAGEDWKTISVDAIRSNEGTAANLQKFDSQSVIGKSPFGTYIDTLGNITVGRGHLLSPEQYNSNREYWDNLSEADAEKLFQEDISKAQQAAASAPGFDKLDNNQKAALVDFSFNVGPNWQTKFPKLTNALAQNDYQAVANELRQSKYARQVGTRAERNAAAFGGPSVSPGEAGDSIARAVDMLNQANSVVGAKKTVNRQQLAEALKRFGQVEQEIAQLYADNPLPEIKEVAAAKRNAFLAYKEQAGRNEMLAAIDRALMAIGQFASAQAAIGTPFVGSYRPTAIDYDAKTQRALQEYKVEADILDEEQASSARVRAAKAENLKNLAERLKDARKTELTIAEKQVQLQEDEFKEGQQKAAQLLRLSDTIQRRDLQEKRLQEAQVRAQKKQQDAATKQDSKSQKEAKDAAIDATKLELSILQNEIKQTDDILQATNSVNFDDAKNVQKDIANLATKLGVSPESLQSGQTISLIGVKPREREAGFFGEGDKTYLKEGVLPAIQQQVIPKLQQLQQRQSELNNKLKELIAPAGAGQAPQASGTVETKTKTERETVWRKAADGKEYEYFTDTKQPTGKSK